MPNRGLARDRSYGIPPQGCFSPRGPGWQLDPVRKGGGRGMVIQGGQPPGQNPAYRPSVHFHWLAALRRAWLFGQRPVSDLEMQMVVMAGGPAALEPEFL